MKLGSLFDGSGTAPLAATMLGWEPVWASEIEPYPIAVTKARLPQMQHVGDITKLNGAELDPVDVIVFGSPCQDLSVAGAQKGLVAGERSNLFFEAIRVIKEMREANGHPRYCVWENVPGAFSSNQGRDFFAVVEAFTRLAGDPDPVPEPPTKAGKLLWKYAGGIVGRGWSLAWRILDAQFWGVPQRRRRIYLVCDLGGERAGEILFKRPGLSGHPHACGAAWESAAADPVGRADGSGGFCFFDRQGCAGGGKGVLTADKPGALTAQRNYDLLLPARKRDRPSRYGEMQRQGVQGGQSYTLNTIDRHAVCYAIDQQGGKGGANSAENVCPCMQSDSHGTPHAVCYAPKTNYCTGYEETDTSATLATAYHYGGGGDAACVVYDARGNGGGMTVNNLTGDHENRVTDYTALAVKEKRE